MTDKGFKFFDECAARCVHLSPEEEECISFPWGDSKMYKPGSISNSQRMLIEINESGESGQNKDFSGNWYCQTLKVFRIISSEMVISLIILY